MYIKIYNSILFRPLALILAFSILTLSFAMPAGKVTLRSGTPVLLETTQMINSEFLSVGQSIDCRVRFDVKVDGETVIKAGSIAKGQVTRVESARGLGKEGYIEIQMKSVRSVDGQMIPLMSGNIFREGEDKKTLAWGAGLFLCVLFLLVKGENAEIASGTSIDANVGVDMEIAVD